MTQDVTITISDGLLIGATIAGPVLAVQAQKWIERFSASRSQKMAIFSTLMATRATKTAPDHVRALNTIDLVFRRDKRIIDLWHEYHDSLTQITAITEEKFIELLYAMGISLGFTFDKVMIKRTTYLPQQYVDTEKSQVEVQKNLLKMLVAQHQVQESLLQYLEGNKALKVIITSGDISS